MDWFFGFWLVMYFFILASVNVVVQNNRAKVKELEKRILYLETQLLNVQEVIEEENPT